MSYSEDSLQMYAAKRLHDACRKTVWFHIPNGGKRDKVTAARLKQMGVRPGVADIIILTSTSLPVAVELKIPKGGRQSDSQKGFQAVWEAAGGIYLIVRTPEEVDGLVFKFGLD